MDDKVDEKTLVRTRNLSLHLEKIPLPCCHTRPCNMFVFRIAINLIIPSIIAITSIIMSIKIITTFRRGDGREGEVSM